MIVPYIDGDNAKIEKIGRTTLRVQMFSGQVFENVEPRRLFPITGLTRYITLVDEEEIEKAIIRNLETLMPESKRAVEQCLNEYYMMPKIIEVYELKEVSGNINLHVMTDRGERRFEIRNRYNDIKLIHGNRMLFRDSSDNRYEIEDMSRLDKKSLAQLNAYI